MVNATRNEGILLRTVEFCGIIWSNWLEREGYSSFCICLTGKGIKLGQGLKGMLLQGPH